VTTHPAQTPEPPDPPEAPEQSLPRKPLVKPRLRGVLHTYAFYVSLITGIALVLARVAAVAYALSVSALFGASALYHRVTWSPRARRWMRRLDHAMIYVLIAGTYTPFGLLVLDGTLGTAVLWVVWTGAAVGIAVKLVWIDAPKWASAVLYVALAWVGVVTVPALWSTRSAVPTPSLRCSATTRSSTRW
jgi:hemolysin III